MLQRSAVELARAGDVGMALEALDRAAPMCPARRSHAWGLELELLAELDLTTRLERLVARVRARGGGQELSAALAAAERVLAERATWTADPARAREALAAAGKADAAGDLEAAQRGYLEAWRLSRPNGDLLVRAAGVARRRHDEVDARRLTARALSDLERESGPARVVAGPPDVAGWGDPIFSPDEEWLAYPTGGEIAVVRARTGEVRRWLPHPADSRVRFTDDSKRIVIGEREAEPPEEPDPMAAEEAPPAPTTVEVVEWELESPFRTRRMEPLLPAAPDVDRPAPPPDAAGEVWLGPSNGTLSIRYPGQREVTPLDGVSCIAIDPSSRGQAVIGRWQTKDLATMSVEKPSPQSAPFFTYDAHCEELLFAPDGRHLLVRLRGEDGSTRVVALEWPARKVVLDVRVTFDVRSVTLRRGGALLAIQGHYGQSQLRAFPGGAVVLEPAAPTFSPSERRVAFVCGETERCIVDLDRPQEVVRFGLATRPERAVLAGDGALWVARQDGSLHRIELARSRHEVVTPPGAHIEDLQVSADGSRLLTRSATAGAVVWDTRARRALLTVPAPVDRAQLSTDGTSVVVLASGEVRTHDRAGAVTRRFAVPTQIDEYSKQPELPEVWLAPGGDRIATLFDTGRTPNEVKFLSTTDGRPAGAVERRQRTYDVVFLPDGDRALIVAVDPGPGTGATQHTRVRALAAAPAGRRDCVAFLWSVARSTNPRTFEGCGPVALSGDARRLAIAGHDMVEVLDVATGLTVAELAGPGPFQVSLDRTGRRAAVMTGTEVRLFDVSTERELGRLSSAGDGWLVHDAGGAIRRLGGVAPACLVGTRTYPIELCRAPAQ